MDIEPPSTPSEQPQGADPEAMNIHGRLPGERFWWIDLDGKLTCSGCRGVGPGVVAHGRVCVQARIGVIESVGGRVATLGIVPRAIIDLLSGRYPEVRWAVADVAVPGFTAGRASA